MATSRKRKRRHTKCAGRGRDSLFEELARLKMEGRRIGTRVDFDLGTQLRVAKEQEAEYGSNIVEQLAEYLDFPGGEKALRALRILAETYDWAFVDKETSKPLANGQPLTVCHLIVLAGVASAADRRRLLKQARKRSLDVDELAELVRNEREKRETERREAEEAQMQEWLDLWDSEIEREEDPDVDGFVDRVCRDGSPDLVDRFRISAHQVVAANGFMKKMSSGRDQTAKGVQTAVPGKWTYRTPASESVVTAVYAQSQEHVIQSPPPAEINLGGRLLFGPRRVQVEHGWVWHSCRKTGIIETERYGFNEPSRTDSWAKIQESTTYLSPGTISLRKT